MKTKEFKTLDEQIEILKSRGLVINDIDKTKELLLRENYFFINKGISSDLIIKYSELDTPIIPINKNEISSIYTWNYF